MPRSPVRNSRPARTDAAPAKPVRKPERFNWHRANGTLVAYGQVTAAYDRQGWQVWIKKRDGSTVNLKLADLSTADRAAVLVGHRQIEFRDRYRTWTSSSGKFSVVAKALVVDSNGVQLKRADNKRVVSVPLPKLSDADRAFAIRLLNAAAPSAKFAGENPFGAAREEAPTAPRRAELPRQQTTARPSPVWSAGRALTRSVTNAVPNVPGVALTHWLNTETGVRHNSSCRWYGKTKSGRLCSASDGTACGQCGG